MKEYLLVAKGNRELWDQTSEQDWNQVIESFGTWIAAMEKKNLWIRGDRLSLKRSDIQKKRGDYQVTDGPFAETKELTGFFIFKSESLEQAIEYAKGCPALLHDSLSLYEMEGDR
jgi:hypothetical protein